MTWVEWADGERKTTPLGTGQRVNLPRPEDNSLSILFNLTADQVIDVSEVNIRVEVSQALDGARGIQTHRGIV